MDKDKKNYDISSSEARQLKLSDITTLAHAEEFQSRFKKVIKKARNNKDYLQRLKDNPLPELNKAGLQVKRVDGDFWSWLVDTYTKRQEGRLGPKKLEAENLKAVTGGGLGFDSVLNFFSSMFERSTKKKLF